MTEKIVPILGITMGDPAGIGPEIVAKAMTDESVFKVCRPIILGDWGLFEYTMNWLGMDPPHVRILKGDTDAFSRIPGLTPLSSLDPQDYMPGNPSEAAGKAAGKYIEAGASLCMQGKIQALVTAPINKKFLNTAGDRFAGHTEMLAELSSTPDVVMMLAGSKLRVALVTTHHRLRDVPDLLNTAGIIKTIEITHTALKDDFGVARPKLAVAALNPHASDSGLFGDEEQKIILPAVETARKTGMEVLGPISADTCFVKAANGDFDAVICMYHDQALIPFKLLHFKDGVNVTLGLPFIRTSVDHGTAYDIAGKGTADPSSLLAAINMAAEMAEKRHGRPLSV